jgi:hypothetical protein
MLLTGILKGWTNEQDENNHDYSSFTRYCGDGWM